MVEVKVEGENRVLKQLQLLGTWLWDSGCCARPRCSHGGQPPAAVAGSSYPDALYCELWLLYPVEESS